VAESSDPLAASLAALTNFFVGDERLDQTVQRMVELAEDAVTNSSMCGITMLVEGRPRTAFFSNAEAPDIDTAQYSNDDGPCLHAFRTTETVRVDSLHDETRWRPFCERALAHGIHSTLSLPMVTDGRDAIGALNFYSPQRAGFDDHDADVGRQFAQQAAVVLANASAYWNAHDLSMRLQEAQGARALIEQAKGILMAGSNIDADRAFEMMVLASQRENRKLRDIASDIVERRGRPTA